MKKQLLAFGRVLGIAITISVVVFSGPVSAIKPEYVEQFSHIKVWAYNPDDDNCTPSKMPSGKEITYIGDSLGESILDQLSTTFPGIDTEDKTYDGKLYRIVRYSKFVDTDLASDNNYSGLNTAKALVEHDDMRQYLIFQLGTNGASLTPENIEKLIDIVGEDRKIMFVTEFGLKNQDSYDKNNEAIKAAAEKNPNIGYAEWAEAAASDPDGYIDNSDGLGVHLTDTGKTQFVNILKDGLIKSFGSKSKSRSNGNNSAGDNKNYAGDTVWSEEELKKIEENRDVYEQAEAKYGVPWQAIATMHSLETSLALSNPANGQGLYQLYTYTAGGSNSNAFLPAGPISHDEFVRQTDIAVSIMKDIITGDGLDPSTDEGIKDLLFQYNGKASQYIQKAKALGFNDQEANWGEGSIYVMNRYDEKRDPTSPKMDPAWPGRFTGDGVYTPGSTTEVFGGFVKYIALGGGGGGTCSSGGDLEAYILKYAWPEHHDAPYHDRREDYADAVTKRISNGEYVGGSVAGVAGIDCGGFVTTLMNESGFAPEYNYAGKVADGASNATYGQLPYIREHPEEWKLVNSSFGTPISDESELTQGDVAFTDCSSQWDCGHTYMYAGEIQGFETHIASASYSTHGAGRAPMAGTEAIIQGGQGIVYWYHKVK